MCPTFGEGGILTLCDRCRQEADSGGVDDSITIPKIGALMMGLMLVIFGLSIGGLLSIYSEPDKEPYAVNQRTSIESWAMIYAYGNLTDEQLIEIAVDMGIGELVNNTAFKISGDDTNV